MMPCNSDDEIDDTWIHTSHHQFKNEQTGLCIGILQITFILYALWLKNFNLASLQIVNIWMTTNCMPQFVPIP